MEQLPQQHKNEIVVYQPDETLRLEVRLENETVWLTQSKLGELFGVDRTVINRHIHNIYKAGELDEASTCAKNAQVQISDADIKTFNCQYPKLAVRYNESFHDRFLIVDDRELYLIGASLKDLGRKCFGFTKMDKGEIRRVKKVVFAKG